VPEIRRRIRSSDGRRSAFDAIFRNAGNTCDLAREAEDGAEFRLFRRREA
jgi:hypothetical protein